MQISISELSAAVAFVGTHFAMSHPLRKMLIRTVGQPAFLGIYSSVSTATLLWLASAYAAAPPSPPLWDVVGAVWTIVTAAMLLASILLMGSLRGNPAFPSAGRSVTTPEVARGVFAITRHPMMWAFALWAICHIAIHPVVANVLLAAPILVLALVGAALQDRKKLQLQPETWRAWQAKTSFWPFAAIVMKKAHFRSLGWQGGLGGIGLWIALTWAHIPLYGVAAGIWRWLK